MQIPAPTAPTETSAAVVSVEYDEFKPETYRGISLSRVLDSDGTRRLEVFNTGNPLVDYFCATHRARYTWNVEKIFNSSTVDNFIADYKRSKGLIEAHSAHPA